ncbi:MAG: hypothetical protein K2H01_05585, partial [Ruminococcus sp.]|nr:hypothetical protein [Ruminococcus sp.]
PLIYYLYRSLSTAPLLYHTSPHFVNTFLRKKYTLLLSLFLYGLHKHFFFALLCQKYALRTYLHKRNVRIFEQILPMTRQKSAAVLCVLQGFLTQSVEKSAEKVYIELVKTSYNNIK